MFKDHCLYVWQVLESLQKVEIYTDINKCEFHNQKTKFFNLIISSEDI